MASPPHAGDQSILISNASSGVKKCGCLKKQKHGHKRFFVLREPSEGFPARLEYYESEKKWKNKSAAKRVIALDCCLNISKRADAKNKHLVALYTKDEYFAVAADSEQEQESWYRALTDLMAEGKACDAPASNSTSSLVGFDEASYGLITPVAAAYKEVWQVNLKSRGLGQSRNLTGVYRLCLSSRTISFVKLNSDVASVNLQLMNIRRCGHSDSFFFIEVGRSASTGPGELWMQADDSVVAQSIHETILEAMKAMKELSEFRPRSKSQSSGTNPISVPTRRHLNNLPPSQTGLPRRSRTDSMAATSPVSKCSSCRIRTASEGDGTMTRPVSATGSPLSPGVHRSLLCRSHTITARPSLTNQSSSSSLQHSKSISMPLSPSPPVATNCSGNLPCSDSIAPRPSSCSASFSGSPSDAGFISCEEYGSSPADARDLRLPLTLRSNTPESLKADTPPSRDGSELDGYMVMERQSHSNWRRLSELDKAYRKRTYSLTTPRQPRWPLQVSSASLDEYTLMRATYTSGSQSSLRCHTASPKGSRLEDYRDAHISTNGLQVDNGYMAMMPGVAPQTPGSKDEPYMPMSSMCVSAPKQIINPRCHTSTTGLTQRTDSPGSVSLEDSGYMPMWCGNKMSLESSDGKPNHGEYLYMSPVDRLVSLTPPDYILSPSGDPNLQHRHPLSYSSLPRTLKSMVQHNVSTDSDQYVLMSLQRKRTEEEPNYCPISPGECVASSISCTSSSGPSPLRLARPDGGLAHRGRVCRPTRLALESLRTLPCMSEHPLPSEPRSPGEYINIDFSSATPMSKTHPASQCAEKDSTPLSDYANIDVSSPVHLGSYTATSEECLTAPDALTCSRQVSIQETPQGVREEENVLEKSEKEVECLPAPVKDDYAEMTFGSSAPLPDAAPLPTSPTACVKRLSLESSIVDVGPSVPVDSFLLGGPSLAGTIVDPDKGAKVIRADPQGRRRHSSETFSSTTTVTPVCPSFAHDAKRHSSASVENVSRTVCSSEEPGEEIASPMCRETSAGYQNGLNYIALNLMEGNIGACRLGDCDDLLRFKTPCCCKGSLNGFNSSPFASLGFKETTAAAVKE